MLIRDDSIPANDTTKAAPTPNFRSHTFRYIPIESVAVFWHIYPKCTRCSFEFKREANWHEEI